MVRTLKIAGLGLAVVGSACGGSTERAGGGTPPKPLPQIEFVAADLSTGSDVASVRIHDGTDDVPSDLVDAVASAIRIATWPGDVAVAATQTRTSVAHAVLPNGAFQAGYAQIDEQLGAGLDTSWYAISLPAQPTKYTLPGDAQVFVFPSGARGVRFSPAHSPVVASVMACAKDGGVVAVYVRYSEPIVRAAGALFELDYGVPPAGCAIGGDSTVETQFICSNAGSAGRPFWVWIPEGVTAEASGAAMPSGRLDSTGMQAATTNDGCSVHRPLAAD